MVHSQMHFQAQTKINYIKGRLLINAMAVVYSYLLLPALLGTGQRFSLAARAGDKQAIPLAGTRLRFPGNIAAFQNNTDLARLLDVGACINNSDPFLSFVPPLDGSIPFETKCQQYYAMKFVLFDLQLVKLKSVDAVAGSFRAELQMIFHWLDYVDQNSYVIDTAGNCTFLCDDQNPQSQLCCDNVWVPPLRLPGCDLNNIQSSNPLPYIHTTIGNDSLSFSECRDPTNAYRCYWRRIWYLNIDASCNSQMDFHNFPFDLQSLQIDILNPYASRTWFQLTKGFLKQNVGEGINSVNLSPDSKIPGWYVKNVGVSGTCGITQTWQETLLTQDRLLVELQDLQKGYVSQHDDIVNAFSKEPLECVAVQNFNDDIEDFANSLDMNLYWEVRDSMYAGRVSSTLHEYNLCVQKYGKDFSWNMTIYNTTFMSIRDEQFSTDELNIKRSFNALNLSKDQSTSKIWFPCVIEAVANLTTPGLRVTILVQRYRTFFVVKLILPTVACVAFSFTAFGLHPQELLGRLTVVVPSAIALTALQGFIVATDMPPVAYIAPSTFIIFISYIAQLLVAYESILVKWWCSRNGAKHSSRGENRKRFIRMFDLIFMCGIGFLYIIAILLCSYLPYLRSEHFKGQIDHGAVRIWPNS